MALKLILLTLFLITLSSCAPKKVATTPVKLKIFKSNMATSIPLNGGVVVVGRSEDGLDSFRFALDNPSQDMTLDLKQGKWEFAAIAWSGEAGLLTGTNRCSATSMIELKNTEASVSFNLNQSRCLSPYSTKNLSFTKSTSQSPDGKFHLFKPVPCLSNPLTAANCSTLSNPTIYKSYKVLIPSEKKGALVGALPELATSCRLISSSSALTLPFGGGLLDAGPFHFNIALYESLDCSGEPYSKKIADGEEAMAIVANSATLTTSLLLNTGAASGALNFGNLKINSDSPYTNSSSVSLSYDAFPASVNLICIKEVNDSSLCSAGDWVAPVASPQTFTLSSGEGTKNVYLFTKTLTSDISLYGHDSVVIDQTPPVFTSGGTYSSSYSNSAFPINLNWASFNDLNPVAYEVKHCPTVGCNTSCTSITSGLNSTSLPLASLPVDGSYFVCVSATDGAGNMSPLSSVGSFFYDTVAPTSPSLILNANATYSNSLTLNFDTTGTAGASYYCFNESPLPTSCTWNSYVASGSITIPSNEGIRTFYAHFKDDAGNISSTTATITIDTMAPTPPGAATFNNYYNASSSFPIAFTWSPSVDPHLSDYYVKICSDSSCSSGCSTVFNLGGTTSASSLPQADVIVNGDGTKHVCIKAVDLAGNYSSYSSVGNFTYDSSIPFASSFQINSGASHVNATNVSWNVTGYSGDSAFVCLNSVSNTSGCAWTSFSPSGIYTLSATEGTQTTYLFLKDNAGNISSPISASTILDTTPPGTIVVSSPAPNLEIEGNELAVNFTGGGDLYSAPFSVKLCDTTACSNIVYDFENPVSPTTVNLKATQPWPINTLAYVVIKASDMAGNVTQEVIPVKRVVFKRVKDLAMSTQHACAVMTDGSLKCWGNNTSGQLGYNDTMNRLPTSSAYVGDNLASVNVGFTVKQVVTMDFSTCALSTEGDVKCWGKNDLGQLGIGDSSSRLNPTTSSLVNLGTGVKALSLAAGLNHVCALTHKGEVKCWGEGLEGALGTGSVANVGVLPAGLGDNLSSVTGLTSSDVTAVKITAGDAFTCALLTDGTVKCWGKNGFGQLGVNTFTSLSAPTTSVNLSASAKIMDISSGFAHTCALLSSGDVKCWGMNAAGQLGTSSTNNYGGNIGGFDTMTVPAVNFGSTEKVVSLSASGQTSCALLSSGVMKCWGANNFGQLGMGNIINQNSAQVIPLIDLGTDVKVKQIFSGPNATCALIGNGHMKCWGQSNFLPLAQALNLGTGVNQMGDYLKYAKMGTTLQHQVLKIASGQNFNCALLDNGRVKCWGSNANGAIGLNTYGGFLGDSSFDMGENLLPLEFGSGAGQFAKDIQSNSSAQHTCVLLLSGDLKCWGNNNIGQLGIGQISGDDSAIGDQADEVSATMAYVNFQTATKVRSVALGSNYTCAITDGGLVYCFGYNLQGQLGIDSSSSISQPQSSPINFSEKVTQMTAGVSHTCALFDNGSIRCWGENNYGQLGYGDSLNRGTGSAPTMNSLPYIDVQTSSMGVTKISAGGLVTCAIMANRNAKCWGRNNDYQLGQNNITPYGMSGANAINLISGIIFGSTLSNSYATDIQTNGFSTCVQKPTGRSACWGSNSFGMLGVNSSISILGNPVTNITETVLTAFTPHQSVRQVSMGYASTCVIGPLGRALCWGYNMEGQVGQGTNANNYGDGSTPVPLSPINL